MVSHFVAPYAIACRGESAFLYGVSTIACPRKLPVRSAIFKTAALLSVLTSITALSGCAKEGEIDSTGGIAITRSGCPAVAVPTHTGDITLFDPPASTAAHAIDVVATVTQLRSTCREDTSNVVVDATFEIQARRSSAQGAREVIVPYFATVVRGGRTIVSKSVSRAALRFNDGELRATARGAGSATVSRSAVTLPEDVRERITRKRKAGDSDAAIDPLADPDVRAAVQAASFELLIGFQLSDAQLQYNATR
jgi:hypothetical protein